MAEVPSGANRHWAVIAKCRWNTTKSARLAMQLRAIAARGESPLAFAIGHEAHAVDAIAIIEAVCRHRAVFELEIRTELNI
jgi:hypothetical protein